MITPTTPHDPFVPALAVFLVCRQVYEEASAILYKNNTFLFIRNYNGGVAEYELDGDFLTAVAVAYRCSRKSRSTMDTSTPIAAHLSTSCDVTAT
jgi:hypothetical protein